MAIINLPPPEPDLPAPRPVFHKVPTGTTYVRIYDPTTHHQGPLTFRHYGPLARFDHHRGNGDASGPAVDSERGIYYAAPTLSGCIVEVFGDTRIIDTDRHHVAQVQVTRALKLLDLRGDAAMRAGTITALCQDARHSVAQQWSRYFYETALFKKCDGLIYHNAHNSEEAIALYERAAPALHCPADHTVALSDKRLRWKLQQIAEECNLILS